MKTKQQLDRDLRSILGGYFDEFPHQLVDELTTFFMQEFIKLMEDLGAVISRM